MSHRIVGISPDADASHVVRSVSLFNELVQEPDHQIWHYPYVLILELCPLKSIRVGFWGFAHKMDQKHLKIDL